MPKKLIVFDLNRLEVDKVILLYTISHYFVINPRSQIHCAYLRPFRVFLVPACLNSSGVLKDFTLSVLIFSYSVLVGEWVISKTIYVLLHLVMEYWVFLNFLLFFMVLSIHSESQSCMCSTGLWVCFCFLKEVQ